MVKKIKKKKLVPIGSTKILLSNNHNSKSITCISQAFFFFVNVIFTEPVRAIFIFQFLNFILKS